MTARVDRREEILERLFAILENLVSGLTISSGPFKGAVRNRDQLPQEKVPGILMLDADEVRDPQMPPRDGRGGPPGPGIMRMTPEVYIQLDVRDINKKKVGEDLNLVRSVIVAAVYGDQILQRLTGANGFIVYDGCVTDLARNRMMQGQMGLSFTFGYPFIPGEFKQT